MTTTINGITARLGRDPEDIRRFLITIQAYSQMQPGLKATHDIDPGKAHNQKHLLSLVEAAGGACAEYLGEKYGDNIDLEEASKNAVIAFGEEIRLQASLAKSGPEKLKRLEEHQADLKDPERELLMKLRWLVDKGQMLTPVEVDWINTRIGQIHSKQL